MKPCVFIIFCTLAFVSAQDAEMLRSNNAISSSTRSLKTTRTPVPKRSGTVPTSYPTYRSHSSTISPMRSQKTLPSHRTVPKSSGKVPSQPTYRSRSATASPTRNQKTLPSHTTVPKSSGKVPGHPTHRSHSATASPAISRGSYPTSTKTPTSSESAPPVTTSANPTTTQNSIRTSTPVSATKTLTVSGGQTASAQVGWIVVGIGIGGSVAVGGDVIPVAGGTEGIIVVDGSGHEEVDPIDTSTTPTTTSTSTSRSLTSRSSSSRSSSTASPTPYNIYPKLGSTSSQQSAFARDLERIAQPGSVRSITGGRDQLLLWVATLTPAQASELSHNPVVGPLFSILSSCCDPIRSGLLMWIGRYGLIWKQH